VTHSGRNSVAAEKYFPIIQSSTLSIDTLGFFSNKCFGLGDKTEEGVSGGIKVIREW
jgi:hypothetical protein